jgi:hypothetical protein
MKFDVLDLPRDVAHGLLLVLDFARLPGSGAMQHLTSRRLKLDSPTGGSTQIGISHTILQEPSAFLDLKLQARCST